MAFWSRKREPEPALSLEEMAAFHDLLDALQRATDSINVATGKIEAQTKIVSKLSLDIKKMNAARKP